jgi:P-type Ca2+ transporter type 2C
MAEWHTLEIEEIFKRLESHPENGLTQAEAARRLEQEGPNELIERGGKSPWVILREQFTETMVVILIIAAVVSFFLGDLRDALAILAIVILNGLLGFRQEYQAERAMAALKKLAVPQVRVRREGHVHEMSASDIVAGDLVLLEAGNLVPADCRLVESVNLRIQEATLTGESEAIEKNTVPLSEEDLPLGDRRNLAYMGTVVTYGRGQGIVVATGMDTQLGNIAEMIQATGTEKTPLQQRLSQLGKGLAAAAFVLVGIVALLGLLRGEPLRVLFLTAISMAVAAVPEGLPAVVTIALALGARRMLKRRALIRKLPAVETLGSVTVICSDKTGTLTQNRMTVTVLDVAEHRIDLAEELRGGTFFQRDQPCSNDSLSPEEIDTFHEQPTLGLLLIGGALCNDALLECDDETTGQFHIVGDPTEGALVVAAEKLGLAKEHLEFVFPRVGEVPFDSERKRMTTLHEVPDPQADLPSFIEVIWHPAAWIRNGEGTAIERVSFTKGAVDGLLDISSHLLVNNELYKLDADWRARIEDANRRLAEEGMRVLAVAMRLTEAGPDEQDQEALEKELIFIGLFGMIDPARPEVRDAVATCQTAGIRPIMITGDHPLTARYIARELGILNSDIEVLSGAEVEKMDDSELESAVGRISVYARVSPEHKLRIVQALQTQGEIAAMTGDGVNDAPALRKADIGVAMGITGTDVSKEASDMVLLDDNFATIVAAVEEGRVIYDNIRKFIKYTLSSNAGEIWVMLIAPFLGMPLPLLPLQILWINLVTDGLPGLALGVEKPERDTMRRPPYPPNENIFARGVFRDILWVGSLMAAISIGVGYTYWRVDPDGVWQTMVFSTLTLSEMGYVMAIRSNRDSLFSIGVFSNPALVGAVLLTTLLQIAVIYVPFLQDLFGTQSLELADLLIAMLLATTLFVAVEIQKWLLRRRVDQRHNAASH